MSIDSENLLFKQLQSSPIINFLDAVNTINVADSCSIIRKKLTQGFEEIENHFIVDSMPLEICKFPRHNRIKICKEDFSTSPKKEFVHLKISYSMAIKFMPFALLVV